MECGGGVVTGGVWGHLAVIPAGLSSVLAGKREVGRVWPLLFPHPQAEPKEDFSHLPPAQRIKKLEAKVKEVEAAIAKANADKCVPTTTTTTTPHTHVHVCQTPPTTFQQWDHLNAQWHS